MFATGSHDGAVRVWTTADRSSQLYPLHLTEFGVSHSPEAIGRNSQRLSPASYSLYDENRLGQARSENVGVASAAG